MTVTRYTTSARHVHPTTHNPLYPFLLATIEWEEGKRRCHGVHMGGATGDEPPDEVPYYGTGATVKLYAPYDIHATSHTATHRDLLHLIHCGVSAQQAQGIFHVYAERVYCAACIQFFLFATPDIWIGLDTDHITDAHLSCAYVIVEYDSLSLCSEAAYIEVECQRRLHEEIQERLHARTFMEM